MSESKHTPGPWRAIYIEEMSPEERRAIEEPTICWCGGYDIVVVKQDTRGYDFHGDDIDDARLIAAAPDLLEAAKDALSGWQYIRTHHGDLYGVGWDRVERALAAAIAKAEGRS